jgi:AcrR family transcriptional regulator
VTAGSLQEARAALVRDRVLDGVASVLAGGEDLTFAKVAAAARVPERTVYRHFPTREALLTAIFEWANERVGITARPTTEAEALELVERAFPAYDEIAPIIRELLLAPEGLLARASQNTDRRRAAAQLVRGEVPGLDRTRARRLAAVVQLLTTAAAWQTLREYWDMDGSEAAATAALGIELVLAGARARAG